ILPVDGMGHFDLTQASVNFTTGDLAYRGPGGTPAGDGSIAGKSSLLSGTGTLASQIQGNQTTDTLTIPVSAKFDLMVDDTPTVHLTLAGQIIAAATFTTPLLGDYNGNGVVDAADYVLWREKSGSTQSLPNDDSPGVGNDDFVRWKSRFGFT